MKVGIVVPCYNEAGRWSAEYWRSMLVLPGVRWLFVDDGSTDATGRLLDEEAEAENAQVLRIAANGGKAEAVRAGMCLLMDTDPSLGAVGYMDADGAFNPDDVRDIGATFAERVNPQSAATSVWSSRVALAGRNIRRSTSRHYIGRVVATIVSVGQTQIPYDTQSGLKLFAPSPELRQALSWPFATRWLFELELLARWQVITGSEMRIWEEPLNYWHDVPGSKIRGGETVRIVRELVLVKREQRRAARRTAQ